MSTFSLATVKGVDENQETLKVPASIRGLALLSQLAVYKDIIPGEHIPDVHGGRLGLIWVGYRIRQLTAIEQAEKVRDEVRRQREGENLLIKSYKGYLKILENEVKREFVRRSKGYIWLIKQKNLPCRASACGVCVTCWPLSHISITLRTSWEFSLVEWDVEAGTRCVHCCDFPTPVLIV